VSRATGLWSRSGFRVRQRQGRFRCIRTSEVTEHLFWCVCDGWGPVGAVHEPGRCGADSTAKWLRCSVGAAWGGRPKEAFPRRVTPCVSWAIMWEFRGMGVIRVAFLCLLNTAVLAAFQAAGGRRFVYRCSFVLCRRIRHGGFGFHGTGVRRLYRPSLSHTLSFLWM